MSGNGVTYYTYNIFTNVCLLNLLILLFKQTLKSSQTSIIVVSWIYFNLLHHAWYAI